MTMKPSSVTAVSAMAVLMVVLLLVAPASEAAITCSDVAKDLQPCLNYLRSGSGKPPSPCCAGVAKLSSAASTTADRRAACACIKTQAQKINPIVALAQSLPGNCGVSLSFAVSASVDCSKIS
ncbi:hypothetical protein HHK36_017501 [Tetracentron sinense]|uniref:Non-specific lipid-transfer protein n=1 Tax=Tetracentron sinense TaxID=13715 RepID=A0A834Z1D9_TETSI|nr:hypothetical protein HHK36_017501 [Tetracentron sinense]